MAEPTKQADPNAMRMKGAHDPLEHLKKYKDPKCGQKTSWDPTKVMFIMDHQAHAVHCTTCDQSYFIHIGLGEVNPAPADWATSAAGVGE